MVFCFDCIEVIGKLWDSWYQTALLFNQTKWNSLSKSGVCFFISSDLFSRTRLLLVWFSFFLVSAPWFAITSSIFLLARISSTTFLSWLQICEFSHWTRLLIFVTVSTSKTEISFSELDRSEYCFDRFASFEVQLFKACFHLNVALWFYVAFVSQKARFSFWLLQFSLKFEGISHSFEFFRCLFYFSGVYRGWYGKLTKVLDHQIIEC